MVRDKEPQKTKPDVNKKNNPSVKDKKRGWSGVFENVTYSSGPGDNIYVYG